MAVNCPLPSVATVMTERAAEKHVSVVPVVIDVFQLDYLTQ